MLNCLIFNNRFINVAAPGAWSSYRSYSDYYFTEQTRMRELYIFGNQYMNSKCTADSNDCFGSFDGRKNRSWIGENTTYFFRPPAASERTYSFITHEALIGASHPLTAGDPAIPIHPQDDLPDPPPSDDIAPCTDVIPMDGNWLTPCGIIDACDTASAANLIDKATNTFFHHWESEQHWIICDLGLEYDISRIRMNHNQWTTTNAIQEIYVSADTTDWGDSLGNLPLFRNEESGWKETRIIQKRGRYVKLVSESVSSPYWSEFNVYVENPGAAEESPGNGDKEEDNGSGSASGCFLFSVFH